MKRFASLLFWLSLCMFVTASVQAELPDYIRNRMGSVSGQIYVESKVQPQALVSFFLEKNGPPPLAGGTGRVPEYLSRTDARGTFTVKLPAGRYYVGILSRGAGAPPGPPRPGEKFHFAAGEPGQLLLLDVKEKEHLDVARINGAPHWSFSDRSQYFTVEGVVRQENGEPVANVVVLGKSRLNIPRPEFISVRSGNDGGYRLKLPVDRPFYLVARQDIASSRPAPGSLVGTYGIHSKTGLATLTLFSAGSPPPGVVAEDENSRAMTVSGRNGEVRGGMDIYIYPVPDPEAVKKSVQTSVVTPRFDRGVPINHILFEGKSAQLSEKSFRELDQWVSFMLSKEEIDVELLGYTDNSGTPAGNFALSEKQARVVADYFIAHGVDSGRIKVSGMGALNPVAPNRTIAGRAKNRRVEIKFIGVDE